MEFCDRFCALRWPLTFPDGCPDCGKRVVRIGTLTIKESVDTAKLPAWVRRFDIEHRLPITATKELTR